MPIVQKAMEVTGIEGNFAMTCIRVMELMRANKESLLAVLDAFVYDPLFNFRECPVHASTYKFTFGRVTGECAK